MPDVLTRHCRKSNEVHVANKSVSRFLCFSFLLYLNVTDGERKDRFAVLSAVSVLWSSNNSQNLKYKIYSMFNFIYSSRSEVFFTHVLGKYKYCIYFAWVDLLMLLVLHISEGNIYILYFTHLAESSSYFSG